MAIVGKQELVKLIANELGVEQKKVKEILEKSIDLIIENVKNGNEIRLLGFGTFKEKIVDRVITVPSTKEKRKVKFKTIKFKPSSKLKEEL